jgi:hypothetical protein
MSDCSAALDLFFYTDTQLLAILEKGNPKDHRLAITYYYANNQQPVNEIIVD